MSRPVPRGASGVHVDDVGDVDSLLVLCTMSTTVGRSAGLHHSVEPGALVTVPDGIRPGRGQQGGRRVTLDTRRKVSWAHSIPVVRQGRGGVRRATPDWCARESTDQPGVSRTGGTDTPGWWDHRSALDAHSCRRRRKYGSVAHPGNCPEFRRQHPRPWISADGSGEVPVGAMPGRWPESSQERRVRPCGPRGRALGPRHSSPYAECVVFSQTFQRPRCPFLPVLGITVMASRGQPERMRTTRKDSPRKGGPTPMHGAKAPPPDSWVRVTGTWHRVGRWAPRAPLPASMSRRCRGSPSRRAPASTAPRPWAENPPPEGPGCWSPPVWPTSCPMWPGSGSGGGRVEPLPGRCCTTRRRPRASAFTSATPGR